MPPQLPYIHIVHLITELRRAASESTEQAFADDEDGLGYCLDPTLMKDAADALAGLLAERTANDGHGREAKSRDDRCG